MLLWFARPVQSASARADAEAANDLETIQLEQLYRPVALTTCRRTEMNDEEYRDYCAAAAVGGLIARYDGNDEDLRHHYHVMAIEAFRLANEMVEERRAQDARSRAHAM